MRIIILALVLSVTALAQAPLPPSSLMSAADAARLQVLELRAENIGLKMAILRAEAEKIQAEHARVLATLQREGFDLTRSQDGNWSYVAKPAPVEKK